MSPTWFRIISICFILQSLIEICVLGINAAGCTVAFYKINKIASYLMIPYLGWLSLATALTYNIYKNNPEISDQTKKDI